MNDATTTATATATATAVYHMEGGDVEALCATVDDLHPADRRVVLYLIRAHRRGATGETNQNILKAQTADLQGRIAANVA